MDKTEMEAMGFRVDRERPIEDCEGTLIEMTHEKTGAKVAWLQRKEENKTFAITFRTVPYDDTGVFHILEHSVLNGSRRFPVKEPFVSLLKSSLKTFLNAITFPDKTMFPVSSRNAKDFHNLMEVYLDAVFYPLAVENPMIFAQEGWHYELRGEQEEAVRKGVVLSEMKGAFASVDENVIDETFRILFPDTCYRFVSGGDPEKIPSLSYEQFKAAHARFYHPSNASVFLDGDLDIREALGLLKEYFDGFTKRELAFPIPLQAPAAPADHTVYYEISEGESGEQKTQFALSCLDGTFRDVEKDLAWDILASVLTDNNDSPLKKAILEAGLGQDADLDIMDGIQQPVVIFTVRNTDPDQIARIREVIRQTVGDLVNGGLSHSHLQAAINHAEFVYREKKEPAGVIFAQTIWMSWLYGDDPALYLNCSGSYDVLRRKVEEGYFEKLLSDAFLSGKMSSVTALPSTGLGRERAAREAAEVQAVRQGWSAAEQDERIAFCHRLDEWQAAEDTPEAAASIPHLSVRDVDPKPRPCEPEVTEWDHVPVLQYERQDSGIVYWNLYFALNGLHKEDLASASLFARLLGELPTARHTVQELQEEIDGYLGTLNFGVDVMSAGADPKAAQPMLTVTCSMLEGNAGKAAAIIQEILQETVFTAETVRPVGQQLFEDLRQAVIESGHTFSVLRATAHLEAASAARDHIGGLEFGRYLARLLSPEGDAMTAFLQDTGMLGELFLTRNRLTVSVTGKKSQGALKQLIETFPVSEYHRGTVHYPLASGGCEGIVIPGSVSYASMAVDLTGAHGAYSGAWRVFSQIAVYGDLWNEVRVKGGAYGTDFRVLPDGILYMFSYRDPDPRNSLRAFREVPACVKDLQLTDAELESYIISSVSLSEPLQSPMNKVLSADARWFIGMHYEDRCQLRKQMLETTVADLRQLADTLAKATTTAAVCITGPRPALEASGEQPEMLSLPSAGKTGE